MPLLLRMPVACILKQVVYGYGVDVPGYTKGLHFWNFHLECEATLATNPEYRLYRCVGGFELFLAGWF